MISVQHIICVCDFICLLFGRKHVIMKIFCRIKTVVLIEYLLFICYLSRYTNASMVLKLSGYNANQHDTNGFVNLSETSPKVPCPNDFNLYNPVSSGILFLR